MVSDFIAEKIAEQSVHVTKVLMAMCVRTIVIGVNYVIVLGAQDIRTFISLFIAHYNEMQLTIKGLFEER